MPSQNDETLIKRDNLYFNFRYRKGSYKAKKMGLQPILITAKRGNERLRIYGDPSEPIEPVKLQIARVKFEAWRQIERELRRLERDSRRNSGKRSATVPVGLAG